MANTKYNQLEKLVNDIEALITKESSFYTEGSKVAMRDLIDYGKSVLDGTYDVPFVRSREFYQPREDENAAYALKHFSKAPSYYMLEYGIEPAYNWLLKQHIMCEDNGSIEDKKILVSKKAKDLIESWSKEDLDNDKLVLLKAQKDKLQVLEGEALGRQIVLMYDLIRELNHRLALLLESDPKSNLYYSSQEFEELKQRIHKEPELDEVFKTIKGISDVNSLEDIERLDLMMGMEFDYEEVNKYFKVWSTTAKMINFRSPKKAATARLKFTLPSCENEQDGLGHVWIDDVKVYSESGPNWKIQNAGFDEGEGQPTFWTSLACEGTPKFAQVSEAPYNCASVPSPEGVFGHGVPEDDLTNGIFKSVYIENPTSQDEGAWVYDEAIHLVEDVNNTVTFFAKVDGKFKKGLRVTIEFYDEAGAYISEFNHYFNKKSSMATGNYNLTVQTDAIVYGITGEIEYAHKVKKQLLFIVNDFNQGIEHWQIMDSRPDGSDAYGAVQGGRILCSIMSAYTLIKDADVFTEDEMKTFVAQLEFFVRNHLDLRDRTELSAYEAQADAGNWQTDMAAGTGMLMMAMPEFPNSKQWLLNANMILRSQLEMKVKNDGSWPESIRYHFAALSRFLVYARALRNCTGENWFKDGPLVKMFAYAVDMQTPPYAFKNDLISTITFGDHVLDGGRGFILAGNYYDEVLKYNPEVAGRMLQTWRKAGAIRGLYRGEAVAIENLFAPGIIPEKLSQLPDLKLQSSADYPDSGIYAFRKHFGQENESLMAIQGPPTKVAHGHYDIGSFMIFCHCQPIVVDLGINGYFDSSKDWLVSSSSHNVVQFSREGGKAEPQPYTIHLEVTDYSARNGWVDGPRTCEVIETRLSEAIDHIKIKIENPEGRGHHIREIDFYRDAELYVITDHIIDFEDAVRFSLCVASSESEVTANRVYSKGFFDVDLEVVFLSELNGISLEKGRTAPQYPEVDGQNVVDVIRAESSNGKGFKTVVYPNKRGSQPLEINTDERSIIIRTFEGKEVRIEEK